MLPSCSFHLHSAVILSIQALSFWCIYLHSVQRHIRRSIVELLFLDCDLVGVLVVQKRVHFSRWKFRGGLLIQQPWQHIKSFPLHPHPLDPEISGLGFFKPES